MLDVLLYFVTDTLYITWCVLYGNNICDLLTIIWKQDSKMGNKWHSLFKSILNIFTEKLHSVLLSQNFKKGSGLGEEMGGWFQQLYLCYHKIG